MKFCPICGGKTIELLTCRWMGGGWRSFDVKVCTTCLLYTPESRAKILEAAKSCRT